MVGPLIYGFSEDAVAAAKVVADFAKTNDKLVIKGGAYRGQGPRRQRRQGPGRDPEPRSADGAGRGLLMSPIQRMAGVLAALAEKRGGGGGSADRSAAAEAPAAAEPRSSANHLSILESNVSR